MDTTAELAQAPMAEPTTNVANNTQIELQQQQEEELEPWVLDPVQPRNLYQKLLFIQNHVTKLVKDKKGYGYDYTSGDTVLNVIKPLMNGLGLLLKQEVLEIYNVRQDYNLITRDNKVKGKSEVLTTVKLKFTWVDVDSGDTDENLFAANGQNDWDKGFGSALTYGERYFLLKYFHIATDKDDIDNPDRKEQGESQPTANTPATATQIKEPTVDEKVRNMNNAPEPKPLVKEKLKPEIIKQLQEAKIIAHLTAVFNNNPELHVNENFMKAIGKRKLQIPSMNQDAFDKLSQADYDNLVVKTIESNQDKLAQYKK